MSQRWTAFSCRGSVIDQIRFEEIENPEIARWMNPKGVGFMILCKTWNWLIICFVYIEALGVLINASIIHTKRPITTIYFAICEVDLRIPGQKLDGMRFEYLIARMRAG